MYAPYNYHYLSGNEFDILFILNFCSQGDSHLMWLTFLYFYETALGIYYLRK